MERPLPPDLSDAPSLYKTLREMIQYTTQSIAYLEERIEMTDYKEAFELLRDLDALRRYSSQAGDPAFTQLSDRIVRRASSLCHALAEQDDDAIEPVDADGKAKKFTLSARRQVPGLQP